MTDGIHRTQGRLPAQRGAEAAARAATAAGAAGAVAAAAGAETGVTISPLSVVADGVRLGTGSIVEELCVIGRHGADASAATVVGPGALFRSHTVVYAGCTIGARFATGHHVLVRERNTFGDDVSIGSLTVIEHHVTLGSGVRIHSQCFLPEYTVVQDGAWIGPRVTITNAPFPRCPDVARCMAGVTVGRDARIGANVTILPGVRIGARALIGAGAIVANDVPPGTVVVGHAARPVKSIDELLCPVGLEHRPYPTLEGHHG